MKKTYVLKPFWRKVLDITKSFAFVAVLIFIMYLLMLTLKKQDERNYAHAIERCGSVENLVKHQTKEGDIYWTCKVDK